MPALLHALTLSSIEGSVRSRCSSTICQTFDRQANESGLYDVDSSWPTEYWVVKKMERAPLTATNRESMYNRTKQQYEKSMVTQNVSEAQPPMSGSLKAGDLDIYRRRSKSLSTSVSCYAFGHFDLGMVIWRARPSGGFFKYFIDAQLTQWRKQPLSSDKGPHRVSVTPAGSARCRDNDLADGVRVLFFLCPRPLGTIGAGGVTPTGSVTFGSQFKWTHSKAEESVDRKKTITKLILKLYYRSFVCDTRTSLDHMLALVSFPTSSTMINGTGITVPPVSDRLPHPIDKVHQSALGSSNTSERTDVVTRPRAVWSLADLAIPSREQNSSTILPNGAPLCGIRKRLEIFLFPACPQMVDQFTLISPSLVQPRKDSVVALLLLAVAVLVR
ncbi:hypothetical protein T07_3065 [Trichinella nelsoni]|uniref:Uncharacterized protein n=1 Tax=Trichinella nelsoni TaxID=6336 RepID=A0A0V0RHU7_9BILA|nr:hypothetical protein T07_3065 [Trichinella nelsoni]